MRDSLLKVKNGYAPCERDSILLDKVEYSYPVLVGLMWIAVMEDGVLNIIDFGGSLGSSYFQNKVFLDTLRTVHWNIVEQSHFVRCGKEYFESERLKFYDSIEDCLKEQRPKTILLSGVIQYLEKPYNLLQDIIRNHFEYIIVDRTSFLYSNLEDRLTVQTVPSNIYPASYPCWFFNEERFLTFFNNNGYGLIVEFETNDNANIPSIFKGYIFKKN